MKLHFKASVVKTIYDHSKAADRRVPSDAQLLDYRYRLDGQQIDPKRLIHGSWPAADEINPEWIPAGLFLVAGYGLYLETNNATPLFLSSTTDRPFVAYAAETYPIWHPHSWRYGVIEAFGAERGRMLLDSAFIASVLQYERDGMVAIDLSAGRAVPARPDPIALRAAV